MPRYPRFYRVLVTGTAQRFGLNSSQTRELFRVLGGYESIDFLVNCAAYDVRVSMQARSRSLPSRAA